jgi:hypothetical protein
VRANGFHIYLRDAFQQQSHGALTGESKSHWQGRVWKQCVTTWRRIPAAVKTTCSQRAKAANTSTKASNLAARAVIKAALPSAAKRKLHATDHAQLVSVIQGDGRMLKAPRPGPTLLLPRAAADHAIAQQNYVTLAIQPPPVTVTLDSSASSVTPGPAALPTSAASTLSSPSSAALAIMGPPPTMPPMSISLRHTQLAASPSLLTAVCNRVMSGGTGTFGLGDEHYGLATSIVEAADKSMPGFVKHCHHSFVAENSQVSPEALPFPIASTQPKNTCLSTYGSFCKTEIVNASRFDLADEMQKIIVRMLRSKKTGRMSGQTFLTADVPYPLLVMRHGSSHKCLLMTRVCFSPLESDWMECEVISPVDPPDLSQPYRAKPKFTTWPGTTRRRPCSVTMAELSKWYSEQGVHHWSWTLPAYVPSETAPYVLTVASPHATMGWHRVGEAPPGTHTPHDDELKSDMAFQAAGAMVGKFLDLCKPAAKPLAKPAAKPSAKPKSAPSARPQTGRPKAKTKAQPRANGDQPAGHLTL